MKENVRMMARMNSFGKGGFSWEAPLQRNERCVERRATSEKRGFSLVEIMIAISVMAIITAIAVPNFFRMRTDVNVEMVRQTLKNMHHSMNELLNQTGTFPADITQLGESDEELAVTASLTAIDVKDYTTDGYVSDGGSYVFRTCPQLSAPSTTCFQTSPSGTIKIPQGGLYPGTGISFIVGDIVPDGIVDFNDMTAMLANFDAPVDPDDPLAAFLAGDLNGDDFVDDSDLTILFAHWNESIDLPTA